MVAAVLAESDAEPKPDSDPKPITKADSDALIYYNTYGYWPVGYTGYYYHYPYYIYGRKKRSAAPESAPEAAALTQPGSDANLHYSSYEHLPADAYTGHYYPHPYHLYGRKKRSPESDPEATPEGKADPHLYYYYTYPYYYGYYYYPYYWYGK